MHSRCTSRPAASLPTIFCLTLLSACESVSVPADDPSPPSVKLDLYGDGYPDENPLSVSNTSGRLRRPVPLLQPLTLVASAEDHDSGVTKIELVVTAVRQCMVTQSYPGRNGVPDGPPFGQRAFGETVQVLASNEPNPGSGSASASLLTNVNTRLADFTPEPCAPVQFAVNDDPPTYVTIAEQSTTLCGLRVVARGTNSVGKVASTSVVFLYEGAVHSSTPTPCAGVVE